MRLTSAVISVAVAVGCGPVHRRPEPNPAALPIDLTYYSVGQFVTVEVDADRVVQYSIGGTTRWAKVPQAKIDTLVAHIQSRDFREALRVARHNGGGDGATSEGTLQLYRRGFGVACGLGNNGGWRGQEVRGYPPYIVSTDVDSVVPTISILAALVNDIGRTAFAGEFLPIEVASVGSEPNYGISATVRSVTPLARASAAPAQPARYALRYAH